MSEKQYVVFKLENEEYGVDIMKVREITEYKETNKIPNTPSYIDGVINIRGSIIPVINLKKRFNLGVSDLGRSSRIIITNMNERQVGFIVDDASQVIRLNEKDIDSPPEMITGIDKKYIVGIGKIEERLVILLDLIEIFSQNEKNEIEAIKSSVKDNE